MRQLPVLCSIWEGRILKRRGDFKDVFFDYVYVKNPIEHKLKRKEACTP